MKLTRISKNAASIYDARFADERFQELDGGTDVIPEGLRCHHPDHNARNQHVCPYWGEAHDKHNKKVGYCALLKRQDAEVQATNTLLNKVKQCDHNLDDYEKIARAAGLLAQTVFPDTDFEALYDKALAQGKILFFGTVGIFALGGLSASVYVGLKIAKKFRKN